MACTEMIIRVLEMADKPMALHQIQKAIKSRYGVVFETTAISARIRDKVRSRLEKRKLTVLSERQRGKCAHVYWLAKLPRKRDVA